MIVLCHLLGLYCGILSAKCLKMLGLLPKSKKAEELWDEKQWTDGKSRYREDTLNLVFSPACYVQRYMAVYEVILQNSGENLVKKVVDFGCAELSFFLYLKRLPGIESVISVDIDKPLLEKWRDRVEPSLGEYICFARSTPLTASVYCGSVAEWHPCLEDTDVVVAIELIEHLYEDTLAKLPHNIFHNIQPKLAIFTTPNVEFNVLFDRSEGFRHPDHKFEWTRREFEHWARGIVEVYPDYSVKLYGIGPPPSGCEDKGCCSQMAVFSRKLISTNVFSRPPVSEYELVHHVEYPYYVDPRTNTEKIVHAVKYRLPRLLVDFADENDGDNSELPLKFLLPLISDVCSTLTELSDALKNTGWQVSGTSENPILVIPDDYKSDSEESYCDDYADSAKGSDSNVKTSVDVWDVDLDKPFCDKNTAEEDWDQPNGHHSVRPNATEEDWGEPNDDHSTKPTASVEKWGRLNGDNATEQSATDEDWGKLNGDHSTKPSASVEKWGRLSGDYSTKQSADDEDWGQLNGDYSTKPSASVEKWGRLNGDYATKQSAADEDWGQLNGDHSVKPNVFDEDWGKPSGDHSTKPSASVEKWGRLSGDYSTKQRATNQDWGQLNGDHSVHPNRGYKTKTTDEGRSLKRSYEMSGNDDSSKRWSEPVSLDFRRPTESQDWADEGVGESPKAWRRYEQSSSVEEAASGACWEFNAASWNGSGRPVTSRVDPSVTRLAKSFSLDSCLENINCEREEVQVMYLSMHSRARTLESGSPSERGPDSGYPISFSPDMAELRDLATSDDSFSSGDDPPPAPPRFPLPLLPVENGDVANNNRDDEGNNVEAARNPLPPPLLRQEFPPWLLQLLRVEALPIRDEGLGDDSASDFSDSL